LFRDDRARRRFSDARVRRRHPADDAVHQPRLRQDQGEFRGLMYKAAAAIMVFMGVNTFYRGLGFYLDQHFKHHNHYVMMQEWVNEMIAYLNELIAYFGDLVNNIQNM